MQIKKFLATGLTAVMAGATLASGALAAHPLSDYPDFLGNNGQLDVFVVVGADAQPADIVGAGDVVAGLSSLSYTMVTTSGGTSVAGADTEDMDLGTELNATDAFGATVQDDDVDGLFDGETSISIGGASDTYDAHDEIRLGNGQVGTIKLQTGLTAGSPDEDFGSSIFLEALSGSVEYRYVFDEALSNGNFISNATNNDPVILNFMGTELRITAASATSLTVDTGERFVLNAGESATTSDGKTVTLTKSISSSKAQVSINGQSDIIDENSVRQLGGTEVKVEDVADDDGIEFDSAVVIVGTAATGGEASDTFDSGEEYIVPCGTLWQSDGCDKDNPDWVWNLAALNTNNPTLGVKLDESIDTPEDNPPSVGDAENHILDLPGGFAWISLDRVTTDDYQDYEFKDQIKDLKQGSGGIFADSAHVLELHGEGEDDSFIVSVNGTNKDTDNLYLYVNDTGGTNNDSISLFWEDPDDGNKIKFVRTFFNVSTGFTFSSNLAQIDFEGSNVQLSINAKIGASDVTPMNFTIDLQPDSNAAVTARNFSFFVEEDPSNAGQINYVGDSDSDTTTANDIRVQNAAGTGIDISGYEENTRGPSGTVVLNPDGNAPSDRYKISIPSEFGRNDFQVFVTIGASGTSTTTSSSGGIKQLVPITSSVTKLDTEVGAAEKAKNLVLVGGPAVNRLTAEAMGKAYPSFGSASGIPENAAWISVIDDAFTNGKVAVVVAGWEADDTRLATSVLQQAATKLSGVSASSATVSGASIASAVITPA